MALPATSTLIICDYLSPVKSLLSNFGIASIDIGLCCTLRASSLFLLTIGSECQDQTPVFDTATALVYPFARGNSTVVQIPNIDGCFIRPGLGRVRHSAGRLRSGPACDAGPLADTGSCGPCAGFRDPHAAARNARVVNCNPYAHVRCDRNAHPHSNQPADIYTDPDPVAQRHAHPQPDRHAHARPNP